jgi:hypothetical protein
LSSMSSSSLNNLAGRHTAGEAWHSYGRAMTIA